MGIKVTLNGNIDATFKAFLAEIDRQLHESCCRVGEEVVAMAKQIQPPKGYTDQTGSLRSSTGYSVAKDGKIVTTSFQAVKGATEGVQKGKALCEQLAKKYPKGYALIVVSGMNYAVYVESKGRDVLTSAEAAAPPKMKRELADLVTNIKNAFK